MQIGTPCFFGLCKTLAFNKKLIHNDCTKKASAIANENNTSK